MVVVLASLSHNIGKSEQEHTHLDQNVMTDAKVRCQMGHFGKQNGSCVNSSGMCSALFVMVLASTAYRHHFSRCCKNHVKACSLSASIRHAYRHLIDSKKAQDMCACVCMCVYVVAWCIVVCSFSYSDVENSMHDLACCVFALSSSVPSSWWSVVVLMLPSVMLRSVNDA